MTPRITRILTNRNERSFNFLGRHTAQKGNTAVKLLINPRRCQGHGRCYYLAPDLFGDDEEGYGQILSAAAVPHDKEREARLAAANCPERAIDLLEAMSHDGP